MRIAEIFQECFVHIYTDKCRGLRIGKVVSAALLLHLIGFDGILLSAKRGESNRGVVGGVEISASDILLGTLTFHCTFTRFPSFY